MDCLVVAGTSINLVYRFFFKRRERKDEMVSGQQEIPVLIDSIARKTLACNVSYWCQYRILEYS